MTENSNQYNQVCRYCRENYKVSYREQNAYRRTFCMDCRKQAAIRQDLYTGPGSDEGLDAQGQPLDPKRCPEPPRKKPKHVAVWDGIDVERVKPGTQIEIPELGPNPPRAKPGQGRASRRGRKRRIPLNGRPPAKEPPIGTRAMVRAACAALENDKPQECLARLRLVVRRYDEGHGTYCEGPLPEEYVADVLQLDTLDQQPPETKCAAEARLEIERLTKERDRMAAALEVLARSGWLPPAVFSGRSGEELLEVAERLEATDEPAHRRTARPTNRRDRGDNKALGARRSSPPSRSHLDGAAKIQS